MRKFIRTVKNIIAIEDLRTKILVTLGFILIYRFGAHVVIPGVDPGAIKEFQKEASEGGLIALINMFSGGAFANASVFALGIMPYISASIVIQLLGMVVPYFQRLQREGESGRKKISQITRYLTVLITVVQAPAYLTNLRYQLPQEAFVMQSKDLFWFSSIVIMVAGTMFIMWLGEKITDKGIGNGISLLIMIGIIARLPQAFAAEFLAKMGTDGGGPIMFIVEMIILFLIFVASIALVQAVRRIPVQYAKRIVGNKQYGGARQYLPLKLNAAGVMPIIFAQALMFLPMMLTRFNSETANAFAAHFADITGFWYNFVYGVLIVVFTYFYTAITVNPNQMAEDMKKNGGFIPGIKPGRRTAEYIDEIMSRITFPGSLFLALVAILPAFAMLAGVNNQFAYFYGGTSLLILVGVVLDTLQQIESHLLMRHYDGLTKSGRISGRAGTAQISM
ncbi:MAG: preprotein translocase subunit SecY [Bacteroidia bacterium]|nr:MAG: preprotein translocase subunit SecY [Bacteroidia bacterium]